jgi:hypothetical protein
MTREIADLLTYSKTLIALIDAARKAKGLKTSVAAKGLYGIRYLSTRTGCMKLAQADIASLEYLCGIWGVEL